MRTLTDHIVEGDSANHQLAIYVLDEPGAGGANHEYAINIDGKKNSYVSFQNGPIKEFGVNGVTQEALLAIVIDRLKSFQEGPFKCVENGFALSLCKAALVELQHRTRDRIARGVEGKTEK